MPVQLLPVATRSSTQATNVDDVFAAMSANGSRWWPGLLPVAGVLAWLAARALAARPPAHPSISVALATVVGDKVTAPAHSAASSSGLRKRNLHADQVPASGCTVARYQNTELPQYVPSHTYAAAVVGGGPAGLALAWNLAKRGVSVVVVDNVIEKHWPNNYGVWLDEWDALGFPEATLGIRWEYTTIRYTETEATRLPRGYGRVDRKVLKEYLLAQCVKCGVHFAAGSAASITEGAGEESSIVNLVGGQSVTCKLPIVSAGHYSKLIKYHSPGEKFVNSKGEYMTQNWGELVAEKNGPNPWGWQFSQGGAPGYQIAYGIEVETDGPHGFPLNEMVLMDWSGEHLQGQEKEAQWTGSPTFLYVMPT
eukprot:EG_transcript_13040